MNECNPARQELGGVFAVCYHVTNYPEHSDFKHHVLNYQTAAVDQASSRAKHGASGSRLSRAVLSRLCGGAGGGRGVEGTCLELWWGKSEPTFAHLAVDTIPFFMGSFRYLPWGSFYRAVASLSEGFLQSRWARGGAQGRSHCLPIAVPEATLSLYFLSLSVKGEQVSLANAHGKGDQEADRWKPPQQPP